jgi:hypothetical protein
MEELEGDVALLADDAADQHAETKALAKNLTALKDVVKQMKQAERTLPPQM